MDGRAAGAGLVVETLAAMDAPTLITGACAMHILDMTQDECRAELGRQSVGRLACVRDGKPYVIPLCFTYDGMYLYAFSTPGQKIEWMRSNPLVCVEFDEWTSNCQWTSVVVSGRFEELPDTPDFESARVHAHAVLERHPMWWQPAFVATKDSKRLTPIFFRIYVQHMTGHRATLESVEAGAFDGKDAVTDRSDGIRQSIEGVMAYLSHMLPPRWMR